MLKALNGKHLKTLSLGGQLYLFSIQIQEKGYQFSAENYADLTKIDGGGGKTAVMLQWFLKYRL